MIAIPNMDKPKNCAECFYALRCSAVPRWVTTDESIPRGCPLMDIVRCGECMWHKEYDNGCWCRRHCNEREKTDFCSDGVRRTDDD